ncbi:HEPN domain-containing protein [Mucilaginibacter phyllosphaerae]
MLVASFVLPVNPGRRNPIFMYDGSNVLWDEYPKTLSFQQIQNPLIVIREFFSGTWPKENLKNIKEWRYYVVNSKQYKNQHGASVLLFTSEEILSLLEACYLLSLVYSDRTIRHKRQLTDKEVETARIEWNYIPKNLSREEFKNPYKVLEKAFKQIGLATYRDYLKYWLHAALSKKAIDETMTAGEIIMVYDSLRKISSAAFIIFQTETPNPHLKPEFKKREEEKRALIEEAEAAEEEQAEEEEHEARQNYVISKGEIATNTNDHNGRLKLKPFRPVMTPAEKLALPVLVEHMRKAVPSIQSVTFLGTHPEPFTFYLLVLVGENEKMPEHGLVNKLEDNCRSLANVYVIVHKLESAVNGLNSKGKFWNLAMRRGINIYTAADIKLPEPQEISGEQDLAIRNASWNKYGVMSNEFFKGAERYLLDGNPRLALFLLHQATERALIGVLQTVFGYRQSVHNLFKLIKLTLLFTDDFTNIFRIQTEDGLKLFAMLNDGYSKARYDENFMVEEGMVKAALEKVRSLLDMAKLVYKR